MASQAMSAGDPPIRRQDEVWTDHSGWITLDDLSQSHVPSGNIVMVNDGENSLSWEPYDPELSITREELKIRRENAFVRELYEQYKVALILASEDDDQDN